MRSLTLPRRFLVLAALMFWQGGFVFYAAVVVPVAQAQIGHRAQGFITAEVTNYLNGAGVVALVLFGWDLWACGPSRPLRRWLWFSWLGMLVTLLVLFGVHVLLENELRPRQHAIADIAHYHFWHRWYLITSTVQWALAVVYTALTLAAWRSIDHQGSSAFRAR